VSVDIRVLTDARAAAEACGAEIFALLEAARSARGIATLAVSGGTTPRIMFEWMARQPFDWACVELFWVDERCVPQDDPQSNFRMTRESLLAAVSLPPDRVHRVLTERGPEAAAADYVAQIRRVLGDQPVFDVVQRGMGPDSHTASLFPGEPLILDRTGIAASVWVEKFKQHRITLLPGVLERARTTLCLVTGSDKRDALRDVLWGPPDYTARPATISSPEMVWFLDEASSPEKRPATD
jgi:6-phosphogluconolactonase